MAVLEVVKNVLATPTRAVGSVWQTDMGIHDELTNTVEELGTMWVPKEELHSSRKLIALLNCLSVRRARERDSVQKTLPHTPTHACATVDLSSTV